MPYANVGGTKLYYQQAGSGEPMLLARWPNVGEWERIAGFPTNTAQGDDHGGKIGALTGGFYFTGDRPRRWQHAEN